MTALGQQKEKGEMKKKGEKKKRKGKMEPPMKLVHPKESLSLTITPSLTIPHLVLSKKEITAGMHLSSPMRLLIDVFPGLL